MDFFDHKNLGNHLLQLCPKVVKHPVLSSQACPVPPYFSTLSRKLHDFRGGGGIYWTEKCVFLFSIQLLRTVSTSDKNSARYHQKFAQIFMYGTPYYCQILIKLEFSRHIFKKSSYLKFHENPSNGSRVRCGKTDRQVETNSLFFASNDCCHYTDRNGHQSKEGFNTKCDGWLIIRSMVTVWYVRNTLTVSTHSVAKF